MSDGDFTPGTQVYVSGGALVRLYGTEQEHYTTGFLNGVILQKSHAYRETYELIDGMGTVYPDYIVLMSDDMRVYLVPSDHLMHPDTVRDPSRLFWTARR